MTSFAMGRFHTNLAFSTCQTVVRGIVQLDFLGFILATLSMTSVKYSKESMPLSMQDNVSE